MAGNAGAGFVELVPKVSARFGDQAASQMEGPLKGIGSKVGGLLAGAFAAAGALGVGAFVKSSANEFSQVGGEILKLQRLTGLGAESSSKLRFAAQETGVDVTQLGQAVGFLSKHLAANDKVAQSVGVAYKDAAGNARPLDAVLGDVAEKFKNMPDGVEKNALALSLFGRSGKDLIPFLNKGRDGLAELGAQAQKFGLVLTQDNLEAIKKNVEGQRQFHAALSGLRVQLGQYVLPLITKGTLFFTRFALRGIEVARKSIESFKSGFTKGLAGLTGFQGVVQSIGVIVRFLVEGFKEFWSGLLHGTDAVGTVQTKLASFGAAVRAVFNGLMDLLHGNVQGFAGELAAAFGLDTSSPLFKGLERFGNAVKGFVEGIGKLIHGDIAGWAVDVATGLGFAEDSRFTDGLIKLGEAVRAAFEWLLNHLDLLARVGEIIGGLIIAEKVAGGIHSFAGGVADLLTKLNPANTELGKLAGWLAQMGGKAFKVSIDIAQSAGGKVADLGADIGRKIADAIRGALQQSFGDKATDAAVGAGAQTISQTLADTLAKRMGESGFKDAVAHGFAGGFAGAVVAAGPELLAGLAVLPAVIGGFILDMLSAVFAPATIVLLLVKFGDVIGRFFTETLPHLLGQALGILVATALTLFLVIPIKTAAFILGLIPKIIGAFVVLGSAVVGALVDFFSKLPGRIAGFLVALPGIFLKVVETILGFIIHLPENLPRYIEEAVAGMVGFFEQLPGAVVSILGSVVSAVGDFLGGVIDEIGSWGILDVFGEIWSGIAEGFTQGWQQVNEITGGALNEVVGSIGSFFGAIGSFFSGLFSVVGAIWSVGWTAISTFFTTWWALVTGVVTTAVGLITTVLSTGLSVIGGIWSSVWGVLGGVVSAVWGVVVGVVTGAWSAVFSVVAGGLGVLQGIWSAVWGGIQAVVSAVWGAIQGVISGGVGFVTGVISGGVNLIAGIWNRFWTGLQTIVSSAWDGVKSVVGGAIETVVGWITGLPGRVAGVLGGIFSPLWEGFRGFVNRIIRGWNSLHFGIPEFDTHIPGVGKVGGGSVGVPQIHELGFGGVALTGGLAIVGDRGPEILDLPPAARVRPLDDGDRPGMGPLHLTVEIPLDGEVIARKTVSYNSAELERRRRTYA